jgi:hypothetical protein
MKSSAKSDFINRVLGILMICRDGKLAVAAGRGTAAASAMGIALLLCAGYASAETILTAGDAEVRLDPASTNFWSHAPSGGVGFHSFRHSWWYRVGDSGPENQVSSLQLVETVPLAAHAVRFEFQDSQNRFRLAAQYGLTDAGAYSVLQESIVINNLTPGQLNFHLYLFSSSDLDINLSIESPRDYDSVIWASPTAIRRTSPFGSELSSTVEGGAAPNFYEMGVGRLEFFPTRHYVPSPVEAALLDADPSTFAWPTTELHGVSAQPNLDWGWQWNLSIPGASAGSPTAFVSVTNRLSVPEPSALALASFAAALIFLRLLRNRRLRAELNEGGSR